MFTVISLVTLAIGIYSPLFMIRFYRSKGPSVAA
jgi:hypothetical protein